MIGKQKRYVFRKERTRRKILSSGTQRPRLSVYRGAKHIYAQVIDDSKGNTIAYASSLDKDLKGKIKSTKNVETSSLIGELLAKRAIEKGIKEVVFDRGGRIYSGRIKAVADGARKAGLKF